MGRRTLSRLVDKYPVLRQTGSTDPEITGLCYDSRTCEPGNVFFALPGIHTDGNHYIAQAVEKGAVAVVTDTIPDEIDGSGAVIYLQVPDARQAMSNLSSRFYDHPSRHIPVIGVTGTDGKSSVVYFIDQLLGQLGEESGFISTPMIKRDLQLEKNPFRQSTPEAPEIHKALRDMIENGKQFAVLEATSHGLSEKTSRLKDIRFHVAVFTNLGHEHLEFHRTMEQYRSDKANLFRNLDRTAGQRRDDDVPVFGVVNADDPNAYYITHATRRPVFTYSVQNSDATMFASDVRANIRGTSCVIHWRREARRVHIPLPGAFNVENAMAALLTVATLLDRNPLDLADGLESLVSVPGRMHTVRTDLPFVPIVDYAHTPGAFSKILPGMRAYTENRLIVLFGAAGERDREKRAMLGRIAAEHADVVILADEDPRGEEPLSVLEEIAEGCRQSRPSIQSGTDLFIIPPRREAIAHSLAIAKPGDTILYLGKGHETSIIYADHVQPWNEIEVVGQLIDRDISRSETA